MQNDVFDFENPTQDYEKISYGKRAYKRVQRLRRKGERRGIEIPRLGYALTKPEKPRIAFWVIAAVSAALFVGILIALFFLYNELVKTFSDLSGLGEAIRVLFQPEVFGASFGLSGLPGIMLVVVYLLIIVLCALPIFAAIGFYGFVREAFYMASCSKEEFAKGNVISSKILRLIVVLAVATILFIVLLSYVPAGGARTCAWLIYIGLLIALGGLLVLIFVEKSKCGKWFAGLDEYKKENYLAHERALRRVKGRLKSEKQFWSNLGK